MKKTTEQLTKEFQEIMAANGFEATNETDYAGNTLYSRRWQRTAEGLQQVATTGVVRGECDEDGYFHFATARHITHGSSGSPIMHGDLVYGLVAMGRHRGDNTIKASSTLQRTMEENTCWAFKATHINRFMR